MAVQKYLFLGQGSKNDPGFEGVEIQGRPYKDFMKSAGINVVDNIVMSCHGCPDLMTQYAKDMQYLADRGDKVVACLEGGLLFGLPSILATQTTFPVVSVPTDYVAYTAFIVPSGHAAIATVGVDQKGCTSQREKALTLAERILCLKIFEINVLTSSESLDQRQELRKKLREFYIHNYSCIDEDALSLVYGNSEQMLQVPQTSFALRADADENMMDLDYIARGEARHRKHEYNLVPCAQVRGLDNLAIFAAKIISLQRPELMEKILEIAKKKRADYTERNLLDELGIRGF